MSPFVCQMTREFLRKASPERPEEGSSSASELGGGTALRAIGANVQIVSNQRLNPFSEHLSCLIHLPCVDLSIN